MVGLSLPVTRHPRHAVATVGSWVELGTDLVRRRRSACVCLIKYTTRIQLPPAPGLNGDTHAYGQDGCQRRTGDA